MRIGLISDTHGTLRPEVFGALEGVERILHAGDIGPVELLVELEAIAPVSAVWGNTDGFEVRSRVSETAALELDGRHVLVVHGHQLGSPKPAALRAAYPEPDIIMFGHTHQPVVDRTDGRLVVNPGSAGPARFRTTPSLAILTLTDGEETVDLIGL